MNLGKFQEILRERKALHAEVHGVAKSWPQLSNWTQQLSPDFELVREKSAHACSAVLIRTPKRCTFQYSRLECKSRKSRDTWSNRQVWPWSTKWSRAKANWVLSREHAGHTKPFPPAQRITLHMDITRWSIPKSNWLYSLWPKTEKLYTVSKNKNRSWLWLRSWTPYCKIQT